MGEGNRPENLEFPLEGPPGECPADDRPHDIRLMLDDAYYCRKIEAVPAYPEMAAEVDRILATYSQEAFRTECLRPVRYDFDIGGCFPQPCIYEWHGEKKLSEIVGCTWEKGGYACTSRQGRGRRAKSKSGNARLGRHPAAMIDQVINRSCA